MVIHFLQVCYSKQRLFSCATQSTWENYMLIKLCFPQNGEKKFNFPSCWPTLLKVVLSICKHTKTDPRGEAWWTEMLTDILLHVLETQFILMIPKCQNHPQHHKPHPAYTMRHAIIPWWHSPPGRSFAFHSRGVHWTRYQLWGKCVSIASAFPHQGDDWWLFFCPAATVGYGKGLYDAWTSFVTN